MSVPSDKFTFFYLIFAICLGAGPARAESNKGSSHMVEVGDGVSLRVIEAGKPGDAPALVFIPGWSTGGDIWRHQIDTFAKTHRVITFDPRSQGESATATSGNTPETRARRIYTRYWSALACGDPFSLDGRKVFRTSLRSLSATAPKISRELCWWMRQFPTAPTAWSRDPRKRRSNSKCSPFIRRIRRNIWKA